MSTRPVSMSAPFSWVMKALDVGRRNPAALFGGFLLMLLVLLVPTAAQLLADTMLAKGTTTWGVVYALSVLASLALTPPLFGAAFRLLDACERGVPVRATAIFDGYRLPGFWLRMVLLMLAFVAVYLVAIGLLVVLLPGKEVLLQYFTRALAAGPGGTPDFAGLAPPPGGLLLWLLGAMFLLLVLGNAYMLAFAQASLTGSGVIDSTIAGFAGSFRNLLPFLGIAIAMFFIGLVLMLVLGLVVVMVVAVLSMVSQALAIAVLAPLYVLMMLGLYVIMFAYYYHAWRDILAAPGAPAGAADESTLAA